MAVIPMASTGLSSASPHHLGIGYLCAPGPDTGSSPLTSLAQSPWSGAGNWKWNPEVQRGQKGLCLCQKTSCVPTPLSCQCSQLLGMSTFGSELTTKGANPSPNKLSAETGRVSPQSCAILPKCRRHQGMLIQVPSSWREILSGLPV